MKPFKKRREATKQFAQAKISTPKNDYTPINQNKYGGVKTIVPANQNAHDKKNLITAIRHQPQNEEATEPSSR